MDTPAAPGRRVQPDCMLASIKRRAWAQSRDSLWQDSEQEHCDPQDPQQNQADTDTQTPSEEPGQVPNNIASWLIECRTPLGASLDDQSAPPSRGTLRNGCSFEDDLSLGAEANHLQSSNNKTESCFGIEAEQKRNQFKERGRSMNSTGSGKSSTVSSVSELLDLYEEDPEEILLSLGFGREEPDLASKIPSRFFNSSSAARGIDIKVYLGAQMQRMEVENPNYALTSRFRQIEVLTTVANEFFQLYSQVSGQPVKCISTRDQGGEGGEVEAAESSPPLKRASSARDVAKRLIRRLTKNNLMTNSEACKSADEHTPGQHKELNGHSPSEDTRTNGYESQEKDSSTDTEHEAQTASPKHGRKKDSCPLATVTEETNGDVDTDRLTGNSPVQSNTGPAASGDPQTASADLQSTNQINVERNQVVKEEEDKNLMSTLEKPPSLAPPQLAKLRIENADSFEIEEISNDDEAPPNRTSRANDLLRTVSQQSDSSGFAEDPATDSNSNLKVQESSDSCDSETTVTSHLSQDVTTPVPMDQPVFDLPDGREEELRPGDPAEEVVLRSSSREENKHVGITVEVPQYTAHQLPKRPVEAQQSETLDEEPLGSEDRTISDPEPKPESTHSIPASEQEQQHIQNQPKISPSTDSPTERVGAEGETPEVSDDSSLLCPPPSSSPVLCALNRAKQIQMSRAGQRVDPLPGEVPKTQERGRGRRRRRPMLRSSSLPTSLLSPSRVVSSVRIQFGQGQASCTLPSYSFKYTQEAEEEEVEKEQEEEEEEGQTNCQSTLLINPASSSRFNNKPTRLPTDTSIPPKPIPRYLVHPSCSSQSSSPPPDWSAGGRAHYWSTQSVPDLSSNQHQPGHFQQNINSKQNQQSWNPGQLTSSYLNPNSNAAAQLNHSPGPSPGFNPSPYAFTQNTPPPNPSHLQPYGSLPNLHHLHHYHSPSSPNHASMTSLHQPTAPTIPQHGSVHMLHQPPTFATPHHVNLGTPHPGSPITPHHGYSYPYSHQSPYHVAPHGSPYNSSYLTYHGYSMHPPLAYPQPVTQYLPQVPEHNLHPGLTPPASGFFPGMASALGQGPSLHPGLTPPAAPDTSTTQGPSSTEMQLRRVLHDIRGTVQSLGQNRADTPDGFNERRTALPSQQSLAEFQQKRRSLNLFRSQMMDLELSIIRQQAMVYRHLSPADRLEVEQLHSLRSAVREELQELEQQLEDRLMELTHGGLHRDGSFDSLSTASALRAMEPVSDLLREQLFLQSELSYDGHAPSTNPSSRSSSPVRGEGGDDEQRQSVYRASINITPAPPPRPNTHTQEGERDTGGGGEPGGGVYGDLPEEKSTTEGVKLDNLQQLIREIRESVAQEVRQEIYGELLAAVSPRRSPLPAKHHPL